MSEPIVLRDCTVKFTLPMGTRTLFRLLWNCVVWGAPLGVNFSVQCAEVEVFIGPPKSPSQ